MIKGLVNIVTPAYNAGKYIHHLLDSVLEQTYPQVSMLVINDGSTDNTVEIVRRYIPKFEAKGYSLKVRHQVNSGQAAALNNALKLVDGEFLVWPDSDDWYSSNQAIEKFVKTLESYGDDVAVVRCAYNRVSAESQELLYVDYPNMGGVPKNIFEQAVKGEKGFWLEPGGWMVKAKFLEQIIPNREIYHSRMTGQNTQLLWPYLFYKKCIAIEEPLFTYLIRANSHSRWQYANYAKKIEQQEEYIRTFENVLKGIKDLPMEKCDALLSNRKLGILLYEFRLCLAGFKFKQSFLTYQRYVSCLSVGWFVRFKQWIKFLVAFVKTMIKFLFLKNRRKTVCLGLLGVSVLVNLSILFVCVSPKIMRKYYWVTFKPITYATTADFEMKIKNASLSMLQDEYVTDESVIYYNTINEYVHHVFTKKQNYKVFQFGEFGYFLHYLFLYAQNRNDENLMYEIRQRVDKGLLSDKFNVVRNDQCAYGLILNDLFARYKNEKYKKLADCLLNRLDSIDRKNGIIAYNGGANLQDVDGIGLVCPFLNEYSAEYGVSRADTLSSKMINNYFRYGVGYNTGLPCQAYSLNTKIQTGISDWGRGCGWLCLGIQNYNRKFADDIACANISKLDSTLIRLAPLYSQFLGRKNSPVDMSSTVFILYYLTSTGKLSLTKDNFIRTIAPYVNDEGVLKFCSPSITRPNEAPNEYQEHHVAQALMLYMLTLLD